MKQMETIMIYFCELVKGLKELSPFSSANRWPKEKSKEEINKSSTCQGY